MQLVPMTDAEFAAYRAVMIPDYAAEHVRTGSWTADEAEEKAAAEVRELLPDGVQTPDHYLYTLRVAEEPEPVGILWLAVTRRSVKPRAFIYDIIIYEPYRRRGYASQALRAAEDRARELGLDSIALHVFAHNHGARALYDQLGYMVASLWMVKDL